MFKKGNETFRDVGQAIKNLYQRAWSDEVCHSSTSQTSSIRSDYIKIINYNVSISEKLIDTIQIIQHAMKKNPAHIISIEKRLTKDFFCGGMIFSGKCSKFTVFFLSIQ